MEKKKNIISRLYASNLGRWFLAFVICMIGMGIVYATRPAFFYLHDTNMMKTYSGYRTGIPTAEHTYGNMIVGYIMYGLYSITQAVPWYTILTFAVLIFSITAICKSLLSLAYHKNLSIVWPIGLFSVLYLTALYYQVAVILYTVNASIACCAGIALLFSGMNEPKKSSAITDIVLSCIIMFVGSFIRYSSFRAAFCFWALSMAAGLAVMLIKSWKEGSSERKKVWKKVIAFGVLAVLVIGGAKGLYSVNSNLRVAAYPEGFSELNSYRAKFMDYNVVSYNEAPEFYDKLGWSESFYNLVKSDYFMDENYNTEALKSIYEYSEDAGVTTNDAYSTYELGYQTGKASEIGYALTCAIIGLSILLFLVLVTRKLTLESSIPFLCGACAVGGCLVLCVYLCWQGRFPVRAYQNAAIPTLVTLICAIIVLMGCEKAEQKVMLRKIVAVVLAIVSVGVLGVSVKSSMSASYNEEEIMKYENNNARYSAMVQYAQSHSENVYIHDITISGDQRVVIDSSKENAVNLILWGGTNLYTTSYYNQLKLLGKDQIQTENFFDEDIFYMTGRGNTYLGKLKSYLTEEYGAIEFKLVDELDEGVRIFKICKTEAVN